MRLDAARKVFGLPPNKKGDIDEDELKKMYRKEALKCHPDKNPGDEAATTRFQELSAAYQILTGEADPSEDEWSSDDEWTHGTKNAGRQRNKKKKGQQAKAAPKQRRQKKGRKQRGGRGEESATDFFEQLFGVYMPYLPSCPHHPAPLWAALSAALVVRRPPYRRLTSCMPLLALHEMSMYVGGRRHCEDARRQKHCHAEATFW
jgi:hypothetical protein|eukprot:COSAG06_NODE_3805_length_4889_cov_10.869520_2_plen_204_part_00